METKHEDTHINESILSEEILEDQKKNRIDHMTYLPGMDSLMRAIQALSMLIA